MVEATPNPPRPTVLESIHARAGAVFVDFHGWWMPVRYGPIPEEHRHVRSAAGLFDLCHMGRLRFSGAGAEPWLDRVLTADVAAIAPGRARYTLICNERGTVVDDAIIYRLEEDWLLVVNASNRERVIRWFEEHRPPETSSGRLDDRTSALAMIAIQGPRAREVLPSVVTDPSTPWDGLRYYAITNARFAREDLLVARTGYTGEDGFEVYLPRELACELWMRLEEAGARGADGPIARPTGLGARDTLRLEAGMPLYGSELDEETSPFEAGLGFAVALKKDVEFVGKKRLRKLRERGPRRRLRGFRMTSRRVARPGMAIHASSGPVGVITSGAPSPTLGVPIAMGYLDVESTRDAGCGSELTVDLRGRREAIEVVSLPFYSRTRRPSPPSS